MKKSRTIHNRQHYQLKAVLKNPDFRDRIKWLESQFVRFDCPVPAMGFSNYDDYLLWNDKWWEKYAKVRKDPAFVAAYDKITGGKESWGEPEQRKIEELEDASLPPICGEYFERIIREFPVDLLKEEYEEFLVHHVFFKKIIYTEPPFGLRWARNKKTNKVELMIIITKNTKKEDLIRHWPIIANEQKELPGYAIKTKEWKTFDRDTYIYWVYQELRKGRKEKRAINGFQSLDYKIYAMYKYKYGEEISIETIRQIISRTKKRLEVSVTDKGAA